MRIRKMPEMFTWRETPHTNMQLVPCLLLCFEPEITASQIKGHHLLHYRQTNIINAWVSSIFFHWVYLKAQYQVPVCHRCRVSSFVFKPTLEHKHHWNLLRILKKKKRPKQPKKCLCLCSNRSPNQVFSVERSYPESSTKCPHLLHVWCAKMLLGVNTVTLNMLFLGQRYQNRKELGSHTQQAKSVQIESTRNDRGGWENKKLLLISFKCIFQLFGEKTLLPNLHINGRTRITRERPGNRLSITITSCVEHKRDPLPWKVLYPGSCLQLLTWQLLRKSTGKIWAASEHLGLDWKYLCNTQRAVVSHAPVQTQTWGNMGAACLLLETCCAKDKWHGDFLHCPQSQSKGQKGRLPLLLLILSSPSQEKRP